MAKLQIMGWFKNRWHTLLAITAIGVITGLLLTTQITSLFPGANAYEIDSVKTLTQTQVWREPINAPYYLAAKAFDLLLSPLTALRITSVVFGIGIILLLSYTLRQWFSDRVAIAGTLFIVTSSWFLSFSRIGTPYVMQAFWLSLFIAMGTWRAYTARPLLTDSLIAVAAGLSLYSPLYIWLAIIGVFVLTLRRKKQLFILPRKHQWVLPLLLVLSSGPLIYLSVRNINIAENLLGIKSLPVNFPDFLDRVAQNFSQIFFRGTISPAITLGRLPLLDIFSIVMVGLGILYFERRLKLRRSQFLFTFSALALFLISMSDFAVGNLALVFPVIMLFAVGGIVQVLLRWLTNFPRNPIARSIGVCLVVTTIGFTSYYHLQRYFIAWANNPDAVAAHSTDN